MNRNVVALQTVGSQLIARQPELIGQEQARADAVIGYAAKIRDWPLLEQAVEEKVAQQAAFLAWWDEHVRPANRPSSETVADLRHFGVAQAQSQTGIAKQQVSRWRDALADPAAYADKIFLAACRKAGIEPAQNHRALGTGENEWFTPPEYIEAARAVMGRIDLDPATHSKAQEWVKADRYFTRAENGLAQSWGPVSSRHAPSRVWLNPPYARGQIEPFIDKLLLEVDCGNVGAAILLTHNHTDTEWFYKAAGAARLLCFTRGRIGFIDDIGNIAAATQGQAFCYYGDDANTFARIFRAHGLIASPRR